MKKVLATTMATLLFGVSFPVNTFALPNNLEKIEHLESRKPKEFTAQDFKVKIFDRDGKLLEDQQNNENQIPEGHIPGIIGSDQAPNGKPQGYVTVTDKLNPTKAKFENEEIGKSEIKFYVYKSIGVKLNEVGKNIKVASLDNTKYEIDKNTPWTISPESFKKFSAVTEDITLTANIKEISNKAPNEGPNQVKTIADKITKNNLIPVDISIWKNDSINWKDGVELDTSVNDPDLKEAFANAKFEAVNRDSSSLSESKPITGKIKVTFSDNSYIEVEGQKLYVFPHVTASTYDNAPKDAIKTNFFLGEGTKVIDGNVPKEGNSDHPTVYKTYKVKPGTDLSKYKLATNQNVFENISAKPLDDSYTNLHWEPNNFVVSDNNKVFTAKATKRYKVTFEFKGIDLDKGNNYIDANSFPKELKDKIPEEAWIEKGKNFNPVKSNNFTEIQKNDGGQVKIVYEWIFSGWNPTGIPSASRDEKLVGTWKRTQAKSTEPQVEKITESDKSIKGQGLVGAKIKITFGDNTSLETTVGPDKKWEVKITKILKKNDKVSITQTEVGKKESKLKDIIVSEKEKENKKPDVKPMPNPGSKEENKEKRKGNKNNYWTSRKYKNNNFTKTNTQNEDRKLRENKKVEVKYIIDVMTGNYQVIKDGVRQNRKMDVIPLIKNDILMLPLRNIAEMIGAKVEWNPQTRTAIFTNNGLVAKIQIDRNEVVLSNGKVIKMDSKPLNINGRILLPVSNLANVFGLTNGNTKDGIDQDIEWDGDNKTVEIKLNK